MKYKYVGGLSLVEAALGVGGSVVVGLLAGGVVGGLPAGGCMCKFARPFSLRVLAVFLGAFLGLRSSVSSSVASSVALSVARDLGLGSSVSSSVARDLGLGSLVSSSVARDCSFAFIGVSVRVTVLGSMTFDIGGVPSDGCVVPSGRVVPLLGRPLGNHGVVLNLGISREIPAKKKLCEYLQIFEKMKGLGYT